MKRILVVDDDVYISDMLLELLTREGYQVSRAYSGTEALLVLATARPDLVLLDLMLPGLSGEEVLKQLSGIPVIILSAMADTSDKVRLLLGGAADYVTKPFDSKELLARIAVRLREGVHDSARRLSYGSLVMEPASHLLTVCGAPIHLTKTEFAILKQLLQSPEQVLTKSALLDRVCMDTPDCVESSLKVHVSNLRKRLREAGGTEDIEAVWGIGFRLVTSEADTT